jgi:hypothetical protein
MLFRIPLAAASIVEFIVNDVVPGANFANIL